MKTVTQYQYIISGSYFTNGGERRYFHEWVWATDNTQAMQIVLGEIFWKTAKEFNNSMAKLENIHYECL